MSNPHTVRSLLGESSPLGFFTSALGSLGWIFLGCFFLSGGRKRAGYFCCGLPWALWGCQQLSLSLSLACTPQMPKAPLLTPAAPSPIVTPKMSADIAQYLGGDGGGAACLRLLVYPRRITQQAGEVIL